MRNAPLRTSLLVGLAAFGLTACDSATDSSSSPESATGLFDGALFPDAEQLIVVSNQDNAKDNDRAVRFRRPGSIDRKGAFFRENQYDVVSFQQVKLDEASRDYFGTFDITEGGRIARFSRRGVPLSSNDSVLVSPKGFDVAFAGGTRFAFVADVGQQGIMQFDAETLAPAGSLVEPGGRNWDVHYNANVDLLFAAGVDGFVSVYNISGPGSSTSPVDRFQVLDFNGTPAVNNHGITYDADANLLVVSDVGSATSSMQPGFDTDGSFSTLTYNFTDRLLGGLVNQPITAKATFVGARTMLGNPVDISGSNGSIFVAEKANGGGKVLRFGRVQQANGIRNVAPDAMNDTIQGAESVDAVDVDAFGDTPTGRFEPSEG